MATVPSGYNDIKNMYEACFISRVSCDVDIRGTNS